MKRLLSRRALVMGIALLVVAGLGGVTIATHQAAAPQYQWVHPNRATVTQTLSLSGNLAPSQEEDLDFATAGRVATVAVKPGDTVAAGQILATLDTSTLQGALTQAQANLTSAQAKLTYDQSGLGSTTAFSDQQAVTQDQSAVTAASNNVSADQGVVAADTNLVNQECGASPPKSDCDQDRQKLAVDQQTLTRDQGTYSNDLTQLSSAQTRQQLDAGQAQAQSTEQSATDQAAVAVAQVNLQAAQRNLAEATLTATTGGLVAAVNIAAGSSVGGSAGSSSSSSASASHAIVVIAPGLFQVTGSISDSQVGQVALGERARVTPAGSAQALDGKVSAVAEQATITSGVATFPVTVTLNDPAPALRSGMSVSVSVIVSQSVDVLSVPTGAVHTTAGVSTVQVLVNNVPQQRTVETGASDALHTEIISGVTATDEVVIAVITSSVPSTSNGNGAGLFTGGGGGRGGFTGGGARGGAGGGGG